MNGCIAPSKRRPRNRREPTCVSSRRLSRRSGTNNEESPHEALGQATPAQLYQPAGRDYPGRLPEFRGYPDTRQTRKVLGSGQIKWKSQPVRITAALLGLEIGFEPVDDGQWAVYFEHLELGRFDERTLRVKNSPRLNLNQHRSRPA